MNIDTTYKVKFESGPWDGASVEMPAIAPLVEPYPRGVPGDGRLIFGTLLGPTPVYGLGIVNGQWVGRWAG